jgi:uncharacterized protein (TIGR02246 family)
MKAQPIQDTVSKTADEQEIRATHQRMIDAWNAGDGAAFAARFSNDADFVAWEGTHLKGRHEIALFTQRILDTVVKASRMEGEVKFVRLLRPEVAVMHSVVRYALDGQAEPLPGRDFMERTVVTKRDGEWRSEALLNAHRLTMKRQLVWDDFDSLPAEAQCQVSDLVESLKKRHLAVMANDELGRD